MAGGKLEPLTFCPGYLRGMALVGDFAIVGLSRARENKTFSGLELDDNLKSRDVESRFGLYVIDLRSGDVVHRLDIDGIVSELYDVVVLPGVIRPMARQCFVVAYSTAVDCSISSLTLPTTVAGLKGLL